MVIEEEGEVSTVIENMFLYKLVYKWFAVFRPYIDNIFRCFTSLPSVNYNKDYGDAPEKRI